MKLSITPGENLVVCVLLFTINTVVEITSCNPITALDFPSQKYVLNISLCACNNTKTNTVWSEGELSLHSILRIYSNVSINSCNVSLISSSISNAVSRITRVLTNQKTKLASITIQSKSNLGKYVTDIIGSGIFHQKYPTRIAIVMNEGSIRSTFLDVLQLELRKLIKHVHVFSVDVYKKKDVQNIVQMFQVLVNFDIVDILSLLTVDENTLVKSIGESIKKSKKLHWIFFNLNTNTVRSILLPVFTNIAIHSLSAEKTVIMKNKPNNTEDACTGRNKNIIGIVETLHSTIHSNVKENMLHRKKKKAFLRFASTIYPPLVFPLKYISNANEHCEIGLACKLPVKIQGKTIWLPSCCAGFIMEYLDLIMKFLRLKQKIEFDYEIYMVEDGTFGGFVNGSWTGIIRDVYEGKADIGLQAITALHQRLSYVDFTVPFLASTLGIVRRSKEPHLGVINWVFMDKIELKLLILILSMFCCCMVLIFVYENISLHINHQKRYKILEVYSYLSGLLFQRDLGGKNPGRWSSRISCITYAAAMTIIMSTYTADLTASNIVYDETDDFKGFADEKITNPTDNFKFGIMNSTSFQFYMMKKTKTYDFLKNYLMPNDWVAMAHVSKGKLDGYIADYTFLKYLTTKPQFCSNLTVYKEESVATFSAFAVQKNSKWKQIFSNAILALRENGQFDLLMKKWIFLPGCSVEENVAESTPWRYFGALFLITGIFILLSIIILSLENLAVATRTRKLGKKK